MLPPVRKAVFLDRDGTLIEDAPPYGIGITDYTEVRIIPGVPEQLLRLQNAGYALIGVTNQSKIAKSATTATKVAVANKHLMRLLAEQNVKILTFYVCPHDDRAKCQCRKPKPGMLLQGQREFGLDIDQSWMIGDRALDAQAGLAAGCLGSIVVQSAHEHVRRSQNYPENPRVLVVDSMRQAVDDILGETSEQDV